MFASLYKYLRARQTHRSCVLNSKFAERGAARRWRVNLFPLNIGRLCAIAKLRMGSVLNGLSYKLFIATFHPVLTLLYLADPLSRDLPAPLSPKLLWVYGKRALRIIPRDMCVIALYIPQIYCIHFVPWIALGITPRWSETLEEKSRWNAEEVIIIKKRTTYFAWKWKTRLI